MLPSVSAVFFFGCFAVEDVVLLHAEFLQLLLPCVISACFAVVVDYVVVVGFPAKCFGRLLLLVVSFCC